MDNEKIPAGKFKAQCLKLMDEVSEGRRILIVTKHGKPVVKVVPVTKDRKPKKLKAGFMKGSVLYQGDIVSPMTDLWNLPD
jgi:prevent-host-death family protein